MIPAKAVRERGGAHAARARRRPRIQPLLAAAIVIGVLLPGCGGSRSTAREDGTTVRDGADGRSAPASATVRSAPASATVRSAGLTITLSAVPARFKVGSPVTFSATAYERHAPGALGYQLLYGDGTSAPESAVPLFCLTGKGGPVHKRWRFTHRYSRPGRFTASLTVQVNCARDVARATVTVLGLRG
jgi:hypothetical protein